MIGITGPSAHTSSCVSMVEEFFNSDFVMLYHKNRERLEKWVNTCSAVIVAGGVDIHPMNYEDSVRTGNGLSKFDLERDRAELFIIDKCIKSNKPLFGICRGHQLLGVYFKIPFIQDINSDISHRPSSDDIELQINEPAHKIESQTDFLFKKGSHVWVNSFHHQGLNAKEWKKRNFVVKPQISIDCEIDHVIEAMSPTDKKQNWFSVQWHPEYDWRQNEASKRVLEVFKSIIERASK